MQPAEIVALVASVISGGLMGALVSVIVYGKREKRQFKVDTLKRFAANRYDLRGEEFSRALNEIFVVFHDSPPVVDALSSFHRTMISRQAPNVADDDLMRLFKAMCKDVNIGYERLNDSFFLVPFNVAVESSSKSIPPDLADTNGKPQGRASEPPKNKLAFEVWRTLDCLSKSISAVPDVKDNERQCLTFVFQYIGQVSITIERATLHLGYNSPLTNSDLPGERKRLHKGVIAFGLSLTGGADHDDGSKTFAPGEQFNVEVMIDGPMTQKKVQQIINREIGNIVFDVQHKGERVECLKAI